MWQPQRLVGALLAVVSAVLLVVSPFLSFFVGTVKAGSLAFTMTITGWGFDTDAPVRFGATAVNAYSLIIAAVLLLGAAIVSFAGARRRAATPTSRRAATSVTSVAAAFALGVFATVLPQLTNWLDTFGSTALGTADVDTSIGIGFWLMTVGVVLALASAVLTLLRVRDSEPATPPYGFPMPVMPQGQAPHGQAPQEKAQQERTLQENAQPPQSAADAVWQPSAEAAQPNQPVPDQAQPEQPGKPENQSDK